MEKKLLFLSVIVLLSVSSCIKENAYNFNSLQNNPVNVTVLAGNGGQGNNNGTGAGASFYNPTGLAVDSGGNVYVADFRNNMIRQITPEGVVTTYAGSGLPGALNGNGVYASFYQPVGVALDASGNVYVTDSGNNLIREIGTSGAVGTFAGTGAAGFANGLPGIATFDAPQGIAIDASGDIYIADNGSNVVRKISAAGMVTTIAGKADSTGANNGVDSLATFNEIAGIAVDGAGNIYVADFGNNLIRKISAGGGVTTLAGSGLTGHADGTAANASFNAPAGIAVDAAGNVYVADYGNNELRQISPAGVVSTMGDSSGSSFKKYTFNHPFGIALDAAGNIYVADYGDNTIQKVSRQGTAGSAARRVLIRTASGSAVR